MSVTFRDSDNIGRQNLVKILLLRSEPAYGSWNTGECNLVFLDIGSYNKCIVHPAA